MAAKGLTEAQLRAAADALTKTEGNVCQAAELIGAKKTTFENHAREANRRGFVDIAALRAAARERQLAERQASIRGPEAIASPRLPVTADECWEVIDYELGVKRMPQPKPPKYQAGDTQRIVVAGDFHAPYHDPAAVAELIANEAGQTDTLIISGDLFDMYSVSRFPKREPITIQQEWASGTALLAQLAAAFPDVLIIHGNHDERVERQLRALLPPELAHAIEILSDGNFSIIKQAAKRHSNVRVAHHVADGGFSLPWLVQVGDLIVSHAEKYSITPGAALRKIEEALSDFEHVYRLNEWRVLIQAHTHTYSSLIWHSDKYLWEGGCMCLNPQGYQMSARVGGRSQKQGYITLTQHLGKTDVNSLRFRWLNSDKKVA